MVNVIGRVLCGVATCIYLCTCIYLMENNSATELPSSLTGS